MHIKQPSAQLDHMLRQTRMNLVAFSQMADTKAHIILSLASVLLSLSLTQIADPRFTLSIAGLDLFLLITIFFALLTVIGKIKVFDRKKHSVNDPDYSPLFFGNYGDIPSEEYARNFAEIMNDSTQPMISWSRIFISRTHSQTKYKYIRLAYLCFFND
jgi:hypothetical protein